MAALSISTYKQENAQEKVECKNNFEYGPDNCFKKWEIEAKVHFFFNLKKLL